MVYRANLIGKKDRIILVDMDGTSFDLDTPFNRRLVEMYLEVKPFHWEQATHYMVEEFYAAEHRHLLESVWKSPGLFALCTPISGAVDALNEMATKANVLLCSKPRWDNPTCLADKHRLVERYLGAKWVERLILTSDKTIEYGDLLIDDHPEIKGRIKIPFWEHVIYDRSYNRNFGNGHRRLTWANWKKVLEFDKW